MRPRLKSLGLTVFLIGSTLIGLQKGDTNALDAPTLVNRAPALAQTTEQPKTEEDRVLQQCWQDLQTSQYEAALQSCKQAIATFQQLKNPGGEAKALNNLGSAYRSLCFSPLSASFLL